MPNLIQPPPLFIVDAFAGAPFSGNPAAVCLLDRPADERWMQQVASEMNLSETAFVVPRGETFGLRWFTPKIEVDLCGHATLASAHILWQQGRVDRQAAVFFDTRSGVLTCRYDETGLIAMDFPSQPPVEAEAPAGLTAALGAESVWVGRNRFDLFVELHTEDDVRAVRPDFGLLAEIPCRGTIVTARSSDDRFDFVSRFFAPAAGIDEDPVTGSAHCALGPYWSRRLGRPRLCGLQVSARTGEVGVEVAGERVILRGRAATTVSGNLLAPPIMV